MIDKLAVLIAVFLFEINSFKNIKIMKPKEKKFEYRTEWHQYMTESELNDLGQKGWELCGVSHKDNYHSCFYFKREI